MVLLCLENYLFDVRKTNIIKEILDEVKCKGFIVLIHLSYPIFSGYNGWKSILAEIFRPVVHDGSIIVLSPIRIERGLLFKVVFLAYKRIRQWRTTKCYEIQ